jgi:hypothetical protein
MKIGRIAVFGRLGYWIGVHAGELVLSYPVGDSWHGEKLADGRLEVWK